MDKAGPSQVVLKKPKKKQPINSELDRQKQAEKKRRRLEKALAASAAIISELEKKKQKKKEEQERLDEEGARVAEAVALHVLLGEDTTEDLSKIGLHAGLSGDSRILSGCSASAEKKRRRLEKALAASAAIISELEKKKQKKKEEQERLDEEGARVAEAVALHVLLGEDTTEDLSKIGLHAGLSGDSRILSGCSMDFANGGFGWGGCELHHDGDSRWRGRGTGDFLFPSLKPMREMDPRVYDEISRVDFCPGFMAAQAVLSLQIREDGLQETRGW